MKFCKSCGEEINKIQPFCSSCGEKLDIEFPEQIQEKLAKERKPISKGKIATIGISAIVLVAIFVTHLVLSNMYKPDKVVSTFISAVKENDVKKVSSMLEAGKTDAELNDSQVKAFITYLKEENDINEINKSLLKDARRINNGQIPTSIQDEYGNSILTLNESGGKFFLYNQITIKALPIEISVSSNYEATKVSLDGKKDIEIEIENSDEYISIGKFLPGTYQLKGTYNGEYVTLETTKATSASDAYENTLETDLYFEGEYVTIYADNYEAILFVNGKSTEKTIEELDYLGPVPTDGSMKIHAEVAGKNKTLKSNTETVKEDSSIYLEFEDEEIAEYSSTDEIDSDELHSFMESYITKTVESINSADFSIAEDYHDPKGKTYNEAKNYLSYLVEKGITEEFEYNDLISYEETSSGYKLYMEEQYVISYADGSKTRRRFDSSYTLTLDDEGNLQVYSLDSSEETFQEDL